MVDDGQVIVLGGLISDDETNSIQKIPLLGDIPLLGALFRYKSNVKDKKNLLVFLHPTILRDSAITTNISSSKYNYMRDFQLLQRGGSDDEQAVLDIRPIMPPVEKLLTQPKHKEQQGAESDEIGSPPGSISDDAF